MIEFYYQITEYTSYIAVAIAAICLIYYRRLSTSFQIFAVYLIVAGSFDMVSNALASQRQNNLIYFHLFTLIELILLGSFFQSISRRISSNLLWNSVFKVLVVGVVINSIWLQNFGEFNSYSATACSIFYVFTCVWYFVQSLTGSNDTRLISVKWLVIGLFIYHAMSMVIIAFSNLLLQLESDDKAAIWITRAITMLITKLLFIGVLSQRYLANRDGKMSKNETKYA